MNAGNLNKTVRRQVTPEPDAEGAGGPLVCPKCAKVLEGEPNFCPACGGDLRGLAAESDTLSGPLRDALIDGRYKILEKLGEGGMGSVFKVEHARMGKIAALKLMRPDSAVDKGLKSRFLQEARVVAKLNHPNTVQVFDTGELSDGALYIAMEYVPGKDLSWHLKAHGSFTEEKAIAVGIQVLNSLQEAHEAGIVHRDIKPANIMLVRRRRSGEDQVKLLDFGIAKLQEAEGRKSTTGEFIGTPSYMSPEQIRGEDIDARSDLYALGAVLFELVTGKQLFTGPTPFSIITQHTEAPVPRLSEVAPEKTVSPAFETVLRKALSKRVEDRYADADSMRVALEQLRRELGVLPNDLTPIPLEHADKMLRREDFDSYERTLRTQRFVAPLVALALVGAAGFGGFHLWKKASVESTRAVEVEPNDQAKKATLIALSEDVEGAIGAAEAGQGDRDLFLARVRAGPHRITLKGVADLNLTLEVLQVEQADGAQKLRRLVFLDDQGVGLDERVDALMLQAGELYLRVEEKAFCTEPNRPPREKSLVRYLLRVEPMSGALQEEEPNDTFHTAQALPMTKSVPGFTGFRIDDFEKLAELRPDAPFSSADWYRVDDVPLTETVMLAIVPPERGALAVLDGAALEEWEKRRANSTPKNPAPARPDMVLVKGAPRLLELKATSTGARRVRIVPAEDTLPGATYHLAAASSGPNGLSGLLDLARGLDASGQAESRRALLTAAAEVFKKSPDAARLTELLTPAP